MGVRDTGGVTRQYAVERRGVGLASRLVLLSAMLLPGAAHAQDEEQAHWLALKDMFFGERPLHDGAGVISLEAPYRAHDAAIVPITIHAEIPQSSERYIESITILIEKNPVPLAGVFHLTPETGIATIATRVRVNEYTNVRAIAETNDGQLYMASKFVKAAGGCSAPALKDREAALARLGKVKLRQLEEAVLDRPTQAQLLISHPNNTGMQMDQLTHHYIPAHFVKDITVRYRDKTILSVETNISLSEDPSVHFYYVPDGPGDISVEVTDTDEQTFSGQWAVVPKTGS